jgi:hypothetical protein
VHADDVDEIGVFARQYEERITELLLLLLTKPSRGTL